MRTRMMVTQTKTTGVVVVVVAVVFAVCAVVSLAQDSSGGGDLGSARNHYDLLGLARDCGRSAIRRAFRQLALKYHPDKNPDKEDQQVFIKMAAAYETLSDKSLRSQYDAMIGPQGVDPNYATSRGPPPSGSQPPSPAPPAPDFDYEAFFRKFDDVLRKHAETHMAAVKGAGIDTAGVADHLKQHLRDHAKMHEDANRAHAMAMHNAGHPMPHGTHKYTRPREDLLLEGLFDDMDKDEEAAFEQHLEVSAHSNKAPKAEEQQQQTGRKCTTKVIETDGKVETVTECVETTNV